MRTIKVIVGHRGGFQAKYGAAGMKRIDQAIAVLIRQDRDRGIEDSIVWLDDVTAMERLGASPISATPTATECKASIDGLFRSLSPDYLAILGSSDVIPHFEVDNPSCICLPAGAGCMSVAAVPVEVA